MGSRLATAIACTYFLLPTHRVSAENICDYIYRYMDNAPAGILAERGTQTDDDTWNAPTGMPNSKCEIMINKSNSFDSYNYNCIVNRGQSWPSVINFRTKIFDELESCLKSRNIGWEKSKDVIDSGNRSTFINRWRAERANNKSSFTVTLRATQDNAGNNNYAALDMNYTEKR